METRATRNTSPAEGPPRGAPRSMPNLTGASTVEFGSTAAAAFTVNGATSITATSPAGGSVVDVTVTTGGGDTSATGAVD